MSALLEFIIVMTAHELIVLIQRVASCVSVSQAI